jgi:hypothetical protein
MHLLDDLGFSVVVLVLFVSANISSPRSGQHNNPEKTMDRLIVKPGSGSG